MATTLAEVLRRFGPDLLRRLDAQGQRLRPAQAKAWQAIIDCRTPALGGHLLQCDQCAAQQWRWNSCGNRHCPQCQSRQREAWRRARAADLLDVPYCHLVFTLPHELNPLAGAQAHWVYDTLLVSAAATRSSAARQFAADPKWLGGIGAFTLVLHTSTQDLRRHLHVHALMACGALAKDDDSAAPRWQPPRRSPTFLFPVHALSQVFKGQVHRRARRGCAERPVAPGPGLPPHLRPRAAPAAPPGPAGQTVAGLRQDSAGRPGGGAGLPEPLNPAHGHRQ